MLGYEWGSHSSPTPPPQLILTDDVTHHDSISSSYSNHHRTIFLDPFSTPCTLPHHSNPPPSTSSTFSLYNNLLTTDHHHQQQQQQHLFHDPRVFSGASYSPAPPSMLSFDAFPTQTGPTGYHVLVPKAEPDYASRIGLNLGGRTYFSTDDDLVSRLYRRPRSAETLNSPKCQAEGCNADLSTAKHYHRRHKVCEFHSKAATVVAAGITQRFCQQCSRFHQLPEFDNGKRSCRKRLADHNRRRRKSNQTNTNDHRISSQSENPQINSPSQSIQRSPSDSGANSSSSITVAMSPPQGSFISSFRQRLYE